MNLTNQNEHEYLVHALNMILNRQFHKDCLNHQKGKFSGMDQFSTPRLAFNFSVYNCWSGKMENCPGITHWIWHDSKLVFYFNSILVVEYEYKQFDHIAKGIFNAHQQSGQLSILLL